MIRVPEKYSWLEKERGPRVIVEALKEFGTLETAGPNSNPKIIAWAKEVGLPVGIAYSDDAIPWCGLFAGVIVTRAGFVPPPICVRAKAWADFGTKVDGPGLLGDIAVLDRDGGGHVAFVVARSLDGKSYLLLGGNQGDAVSLAWFPEKDRIKHFRRCPWKIAQPKEVRDIRIAVSGKFSQSEA